MYLPTTHEARPLGGARVCKIFCSMVLVAALALAFTGLAVAQNADTAEVLGTVVDSQGALMAGVTVKATNTETGLARTDVTTAAGTYRLRPLTPGPYELTAEGSGFQTSVRKGVTLAVGAQAVIDFTLQVAGVVTEVVVQANAPIVDTVSQTTGANLDPNQISLLPTISRNYTDFLRVVSGAMSIGGSVAVLGAREASNNFQLDGVDNTSDSSGGQRQSPQLDAIEEFQVLTSAFKAEYGHAAGGVVTAISKTGTNNFHGSLYMYYRDEGFRAYSPFDNQSVAKAPFRRMYNGGTFGGPIQKNKVFFFLAYERLYQDQNTEATWVLPTTMPAFSTKTLTFFQKWGVDPTKFSGGQQRFVTAAPQTNHQPSARIDMDLGKGHSLSARYQFYQTKRTTNRTGTLFDWASTSIFAHNNDANINHKWIMSPTRVNEFYLLYTRDLNSYLNDYTMPIISISSANVTLGGSSNYPQGTRMNRLQLKDNMTWILGKHDVKFGGEVKLAPFNALVANFFQGSYSFTYLANPTPNPTLASLENGIPSSLTVQLGNPILPFHNSIFGFFVQDTWRVKPKLTLSYGLRYDYQISKVPAVCSQPCSFNYYGLLPRNGAEDPAIAADKNNFAPRFGFTWAPNDSNAIYGGTGIFYDQVIVNNWISALFTPPFRTMYTVTLPPFPDLPTSYAALSAPSVGFMAPNFHAPWAFNSTLGYRRQLTPNMGIDVSAVVNRSYAQQMAVNLNPGRTGSASITGTGYVRLNPNLGGVTKYYNGGRSRYNGFRFEFKRRMSNRISGGIAYTLAWSSDNSYNMISRIQVLDAPWLNWGPSNYDIRHNFVSHVEASLPFGIQFAAILEARTPRPLDVTAGSYDLNGDGTTGDWVNEAICVKVACPGFNYTRNKQKQLSTADANKLRALFGLAPIASFAKNPGFWNTDVSLRKQIKIGEHHSVSLIAEAFNAFNIYQYNAPTATTSSGLFGQRTSVVQPRTAQIAVHYRF